MLGWDSRVCWDGLWVVFSFGHVQTIPYITLGSSTGFTPASVRRLQGQMQLGPKIEPGWSLNKGARNRRAVYPHHPLYQVECTGCRECIGKKCSYKRRVSRISLTLKIQLFQCKGPYTRRECSGTERSVLTGLYAVVLFVLVLMVQFCLTPLVYPSTGPEHPTLCDDPPSRTRTINSAKHVPDERNTSTWALC